MASAGEALLSLVHARRGESGIVYCLSRKSVEKTAEDLRGIGIRALAYHAGMEPEVRTRVQDAFRRDDADVVVATIAFGMGIDKSNVRYVIHKDMPRSIESYYQEIGRAGRDGVPSDCVLFYSWADVLGYDRFSDDLPQEIAYRQRQQVREMFTLADRGGCRHQAVVGYLGETIDACRESCDTCAGWDLLAAAPPMRRGRQVRQRKGERNARVATPPVLPAAAPTADEALFTELKKLRKEIADERAIPAYLVFSDATLAGHGRRPSANGGRHAGGVGRGPGEAGVVRRSLPGAVARLVTAARSPLPDRSGDIGKTRECSAHRVPLTASGIHGIADRGGVPAWHANRTFPGHAARRRARSERHARLFAATLARWPART